MLNDLLKFTGITSDEVKTMTVYNISIYINI